MHYFTVDPVIPSKCVDKLNCHQYGIAICTAPDLQAWVQKNCPLYCHSCRKYSLSFSIPTCVCMILGSVFNSSISLSSSSSLSTGFCESLTSTDRFFSFHSKGQILVYWDSFFCMLPEYLKLMLFSYFLFFLVDCL